MNKNRLEAFSDGVLAVIITIMVLEMKAPQGSDLNSLRPLLPIFVSYVLSFIYIGIYWNNHHHFFQAVEKVNGAILWANLHLLFWLSLIPFLTMWLGQNSGEPWPVALYGIALLFAAMAYNFLTMTIIKHHGKDSVIASAIGSDKKGKISLILYAASIPLAFFRPWISYLLYAAVALIWLVPDQRIEKRISKV